VSIDVRIDDAGVATVVIDRPERRNALRLADQRELDAVWQRLEATAGVRVAVLTGAGDQAFCAGADMKAADPDGLAYLEHRLESGFGGISLRRTLPVPVVARVNGHALGGGFEMVLGCDLAVAADHATFGLPEALVGRVPLDGGVALLAGALPPKLAAELLLTGRRLSAAEALELGLVNRVVPGSELDAAVAELVAARLAAAPLSHAAIKEMLATGDPVPPRTLRALSSEDGREGVAAFGERRPPVWRGV
jgi:crotonobetainyl-CoA hydratase